MPRKEPTVALADRLNQVPGGRRDLPKCQTGAWLRTQSAANRNAFNKWVEAGNNKLILLEQCKLEGLDVTASSFYRHLNSNCHCDPEIRLYVEDLAAAQDEIARLSKSSDSRRATAKRSR